MAESLCAFCRRHPVDPAWRPFCSERCRLQDLARWADGKYRIPGDPVRPAGPAASDDESAAPPGAGPAGDAGSAGNPTEDVKNDLKPETARPTRNAPDQ